MHVYLNVRICQDMCVVLKLRYAVSEMAALCVPETEPSSCMNLYEEYGKALGTRCFLHIVELDNYAVPSF